MAMPERTSPACEACDANCCKAFSLDMTKAAMRRCLVKGGCGSVDTAHTFLWAVLWCRRIKRPEGGSRKHRGEGRAYWYECTLLDPDTGRCRHYGVRPPACRNFLCEKAGGDRKEMGLKGDRNDRT